ncbi:MAG: protease inhibitor I42 family protein [Pseudomonadota bacterium]
MSQITLTQADNGKSIPVAAGTTLVVQLEENPTTGFRWEVEKDDTNIVALRASDYKQPVSSQVGASGLRVMTFEAKQPGNTKVVLVSRRGWQAREAKRYSVDVTVQ